MNDRENAAMAKAHGSCEDSYLGQLRQLVGPRSLIAPGARAIVRDEHGRVRNIRHADNGDWAMPAGFMELNESILDCLKREVREETGLEVLAASPIALYTEPRFAHTSVSGDHIQMFAAVFRVNLWQGSLTLLTAETTQIRFFALDEAPQNMSAIYRETLADLEHYEQTGQFTLK
jgi:ADP-ribose pyrophosphatase YjhB (NUDIX family)